MQIIRLTEVIIGTNTTTLVSCVLFACGNKNAVYPQFLVRERQFVTTNLLFFVKIKNIKIVFVQQSNTSLDNKMINDIERKEFFGYFWITGTQLFTDSILEVWKLLYELL